MIHSLRPDLSFAPADGGRIALQRAGRTLAWLATPVGCTPERNGWRLDLPAGARITLRLPPLHRWYGQGEFIHQAYPLDRLQFAVQPLATWDNGPNGFSCIQESFWLASCGLGVLVPVLSQAVRAGMNPLSDEVASGGWRPMFETGHAARPELARDEPSRTLVLEFTADTTLQLLIADDAPQAFALAASTLGTPTATPPEALLAAPIWTTWAKYKTAIDQATVLAFARAIRAHGYPGSTIEIDDRWQREYGDNAFDPARFPDPRAMVRELDGMGFAVTLWTTPFFSDASANTAEAREAGHLVRDVAGAPCRVRWWQGEAALLDLTRPAARAWWADKLHALQRETGLAGYKFDAGESNFVPADAALREHADASVYSQLWAAFGAEHFPYGEVRCGWRGQRNPILYRQWDKFSTWGLDNGLASVLSGALNLGLTGYPFVLPDIIGGNAYGNSVSAELMVRWTQACAPMLAIQFSIPPWELGDDADAICRRYAQLHVELLPRRLAAARQAVASGAPVVRPLFWCAPDDAETYAIADQYLLGDDLLVAPVLTEGARERDVYLPAGRWREWKSSVSHEGGRWLRGVAAPLEALPLFERES